MKIWEILKEENIGKIYRYNGKNYEVYEANAGLNLRVQGSMCDTLDINVYNFMNMDFEEMGEKVCFYEVLHRSNDCKVIHHYIEEYKGEECACDDFLVVKYWNKIINDEYLSLDELLLGLSWMFDENELKEIINNGEWYLKNNEY